MLRRIHTYLGLLCFSHFLVYGIAGLAAAAQRSLARPKTPINARYEPFTAAPNLTDKQVADLVFDQLKLPFTRPMPDWYLRRTPSGDLLLDFLNINGIYRVTVLAKEQRVKIEEIRNSAWLFLEDIHAGTVRSAEHMTLLRLWGFYNEFAMWSLLAMSTSGAYLWLATRGRRGIHRKIATVALPFVLLYAVSAIQITHASWLGPALFKRLHRTAGFWHNESALNLWSVFAALTSLAVVLLGMTGVWLWFTRHRDRVIGAILLAANVATSLTLLWLIRFP